MQKRLYKHTKVRAYRTRDRDKAFRYTLHHLEDATVVIESSKAPSEGGNTATPRSAREDDKSEPEIEATVYEIPCLWSGCIHCFDDTDALALHLKSFYGSQTFMGTHALDCQ